MKQNVLFLFTDQQRHDTISALGNPVIKTPALDRLVREGVSFTRCYTPSPVCVSARNSIVTGLPPHVTGCVDNKKATVEAPSFIEYLSEGGYRTHGVGKMHFVPRPKDMRGFQSRDFSEPSGNDDYKKFLTENGYDYVKEPFGVRSEYYYIPQVSQLPASMHHSHWVADKTIQFLRDRSQDQPFFLWSSFIKPHPPFESPTPWNKLYRAVEMSKPYRPDHYEDQQIFWNKVQNRYKYKDAGTDDLLNRTTKAAYYSSISFIDYNIGRILDALGEEIDNTFIVFASDHGEMLGDFGAFGKRCMLDGSARVPLIIRHPNGTDAGKRVTRPASLTDLHATILSICGCGEHNAHPENVDLRNLVEDGPERYVFSHFSEEALGTYMITDGRWKYSYCAADEREWLYDLESEAGEANNLIQDGAYAVEAERLRSRLIARFEEDGYSSAVEHGEWKTYGTSEMPEEADYGLLFQDPPTMQQFVDELGIYARPVLPAVAQEKRDVLTGVRRNAKSDD